MTRAKIPIRIVLIVFGIILCYFVLSTLNLIPRWGGCISNNIRHINTLEGVVFDVVDTDCDGLAKDDLISVVATSPDDGATAVIFKYDPARESKLPDIKIIEKSGKKIINISIELISSIADQQFVWHGMSINYNIGRVEFVGKK